VPALAWLWALARPWALARLWALALLWALAGCARPATPSSPDPPPPSPTRPTPTATVTLTAVPGPGPIEWVSLSGVGNLADDPSWACQDGVTLRNRGFAVAAGESYQTIVNARGPMLEFGDSFSIEATLEVEHGEWGAFTLFGTLPHDPWWEGTHRLDLEWQGATLAFVYWDGSGEQPVISTSYSVPGTSGQVRIGLRREGTQLYVLVEGQQVAQLDDPGMFPENRAYLGANVPPRAAVYLYEIEAGAPLGREETVVVQSAPEVGTYVPTAPSLRELAQARDVSIGAAVSATPLRCDPTYAEVLRYEYDLATTENALKFGPVHPTSDRYDWRDADDIVDLAEAQGMRVRGHTLVWHHQLPPWIEEGEWTREELVDVLHEHIAAVVGRYRGRIYAWDVVNEAIDGSELRDTIWLRTIGPEYIDMAFRWAHEADPDALLFYNDYGGEGMNAKSEAIYDLVAGLRERGVPIDGVGLQMHVLSGQAPLPREVTENMDRLGGLDLQVHVTELDVRIEGEPSDEELETQARTYQRIAESCLAARNCTALVTWGLSDRYSWIPGQFPGWGSALLLDEAFQPKPAYHALADALRGP
jgi:endo-1,4-beta-xylanase